MPVTFQTDLKDIHEQPYVQQIPLDAMFRGMGYKQAEWDQGVQQAKGVMQAADNVLRGYGPDEQAASDIKNQLAEQVKSFAGQDFSKPDVLNQFNSYVNGVINSPDVQGIRARTVKKEGDLRLLKEYQDKGKEVPLFLQPSIQQANQYESSGKYDPSVRYRGEVTIAPDVKSWLKDIHEKLQPDIDEHGNKYVSAQRYADALKADLKFHPEMEQYLRLEHDSKLPQGFNWDDHATATFNQTADKHNQTYVYYKEQANAALEEAKAASAKGNQTLYANAVAKYQKAHQVAEQASQAANEARTHAESRDKGYFLQRQSQQDYIDGAINDWANAQHYTQHGMSEQEKLLFQRETEYGKIDREGKIKKEIEEMKTGATGTGPSILLDQYYDALAGRTPTGGVIDSHVIGENDSYDVGKPVTAKILQDKFHVPNAPNTAGNENWIPIGSVPEVVHKALDQETDRDANQNVIRQTNLAVDDKGNYLIFRSADGKKLGYVKQIYNKDNDDTERQFEVMDETAAKTKGAVGKTLKEQSILNARTQEQYEKERATKAGANPASTIPPPPKPVEKPGTRSFYIPGNTKPFQIPEGSVSAFLTDNPTAVPY